MWESARGHKAGYGLRRINRKPFDLQFFFNPFCSVTKTLVGGLILINYVLEVKDVWGRRVKILKPVVEKAMFSESIYKLILVHRKSASA